MSRVEGGLEGADGAVLTRDDLPLAERLDARLDQVAGLRYQHLCPAANLHMGAALAALERFRAEREARTGVRLGLTAPLVRAAALALEEAPLLACLFDGRDRLVPAEHPALGVSVDTGDAARCLVLERARGLGLEELAVRIREAAARFRAEAAPAFRRAAPGAAPAGARRRRLAHLLAREVRERFAYLLPGEVERRFAGHAARQGHFTVHNLGALGVDEFKGFLRRPALAALWALTAQRRVVRGPDGRYAGERRLPLVLIFSQDLVPLDQACAFLRGIVRRIEQPVSLLEGAP
ncbi:MAG TPA: 2-oxo acid dehydrogenase subunit E2 [Myxococcota bacterium]|nr:2-oxo acid dehydrogenase subunit E2 [Myxococcota bacterium]HRY95278.1 2-oxo acid dehydrogenase subunit E2 [Myxococcota bacterium]HSA22191.1 2-oxo acid dehydrogenase subunit E2 [Myxococcota bacterium]